jgi:hypothetical protein
MSDKSLEYAFQKIDKNISTFLPMTARIVLSFIEKKRACGSIFFDLAGNFWIDREKNERILKDVKRIERSGILIKN